MQNQNYQSQPLQAGTQALGEPQRPGQERKDGTARGSAFLIAILIHVLVLLLLGFIVLQSVKENPPELMVESSSMESPIKVDPKRFAKPAKPEPSAPSMAKAMVISSVAPASVTVPSIEETESFEVGMGSDFGAGLGIGTGGFGGGGVGFFGSKSTAERVVFIVDVSGSLSNRQFEMIKEELTKSLKRLAANIQYQVIFFAGPAWFAEHEMVSRQDKRFTLKDGREEYIWDTPGAAHMYELKNRKDLPTAEWRQATKANLHKTARSIEKVKKIFGTDWEWPLKIALEQMEPKPDVIYFLTDGATSDASKTLEEINKINRRKGKKAKINTIAMMEPRAVGLLKQLAKDAGGQFTVVHEDGSVTVDGKRQKKEKK